MAEETPASSRIFISYRREDSSGHVLALIPPLRAHFGASRIFKDTDNIAPGQDFIKAIERELESCSVVVAVISRDWLTIQDPRLKCRRLDTPNDFLRLELSTALHNERILVIPVLVGRATMPAPEDLPPDLQQLARRNALELSDLRWDSDVERLIRAIEEACAPPAAERAATSADRAAGSTSEPSTDSGSTAWEVRDLGLLESRRQRQIAKHVSAARQALKAGDYQTVLQLCEKAAWLDPHEPESLELAERAQKALNDQKIQEWLANAQRELDRGELAAASELIDQALLLNAASEPALTLRRQLLKLRRRRERERERGRLVQAAVDRARASFEANDCDAAVQHADDALALAANCQPAIELRARAVAVLEERRQQIEHNRAEQQAAAEARDERAIEGRAAALIVDPFSPPEKVVSEPLVESHAAIEAEEYSRREHSERWAESHAAIEAEEYNRREHEPREQEPLVHEQHDTLHRPQETERAIEEAAVSLVEAAPVREESEARRQPVPVAATIPIEAHRRTGYRFISRPVQVAAAVLVLVGGTWTAAVLLRTAPDGARDLSPNQAQVSERPARVALPSPERRMPAAENAGGSTALGTGGSTQTESRSPQPAPIDVVQSAPAAVPNVSETPNGSAAESLANKPAAPARPRRLEELTTRARTQAQSGQRAQALSSVLEGLQIDPKDSTLRTILDSLLRDAQSGAKRSKQEAVDVNAHDRAGEEFDQGLQKEREAVRLNRAGRIDAATRSFWAAADQFAAAAAESRLVIEDEEAEQTRSANAKPPIKSNDNERGAEHRPPPAGETQAERKPPDTAFDQEVVRQVLRRYEAAYAGLSADGVRSVFPSVPAEQLVKDFAGYRSYALKVQIDNFKFYFFSETRTSVVVTSRVVHDIQPKSGERTQFERPQIFTLEKQGKTWVIVQVR